jgi:hypothetical protein
MNKYSLRKIALLFALPVAFVSCESFVEGFEKDPNNPTDAPVSTMMPGIEVGHVLFHSGQSARFSAIYTDQMNGSDRQFVDYENYVNVASDFDDVWDQPYTNVIKQTKIARTKWKTAGNARMEAVTMILEAHTWITIAALWGDAPFSEAVTVGIQNPVYDSQASIYTGALAMLDTAVTKLGAGPGSITSLFGGSSAAAWTQRANTLRARIALHRKDYASAITFAQAGINSAANNWVSYHGPNYGSDMNVFFSFLEFDRFGYITTNSTNTMRTRMVGASADFKRNAKTDESARDAWYFYPGEDLPNTLDVAYYGEAAEGYFGSAAPYKILSAGENQLILAEALIKQATPDLVAALTALNGHRAYLASTVSTEFGGTAQYDAYVAADFQAGGMANNGTDSEAQALLREVLLSKYFYLYGHIEAFTDMRRTNNFLGIRVKGPAATTVPQRFLYSQVEVNSNTNTPKPQPGLFDKTALNNTAY